MRCRLVGAAVLLGAAVTPWVPARTPARADVPVVFIDGKGWGHGVGMSQDGAFWMAKAGQSAEKILGQFYPGTGIGKGSGTVRVVVGGGPAVTLAFPNGGEIRDSAGGAAPGPGFPVRVAPGRSVRLVAAGAGVRVEGGSPTVAAQSVGQPLPTLIPPSPTTTAPPAGGPGTTLPVPAPTTRPPATGPAPTTATTAPGPPPTAAPPGSTSPHAVWAVPAGAGVTTVADRNRSYRGIIEAAPGIRLVNQVDIETYLKGMGEVRDGSWPAAALQTQAIAARTYALRAQLAAGPDGAFCDDTRCQVYLGSQAEYAAMNKAVDASKGKVLVYNKTLAAAVYSASGGGFEATPQEGFGAATTAYPYLTARPYLTQDPKPWNVAVTPADLAAHLGYKGTLTAATVSSLGPSGRALEVTVNGSAGPLTVGGIAFQRALGLRSTLFTLRLGDAAAPPPLLPAGDDGGPQTLPDQAGEAIGPAGGEAGTTAFPTTADPSLDAPPGAAFAGVIPAGGSSGQGWWEAVAGLACLTVGSAAALRWRRRD